MIYNWYFTCCILAVKSHNLMMYTILPLLLILFLHINFGTFCMNLHIRCCCYTWIYPVWNNKGYFDSILKCAYGKVFRHHPLLSLRKCMTGKPEALRISRLIQQLLHLFYGSRCQIILLLHTVCIRKHKMITRAEIDCFTHTFKHQCMYVEMFYINSFVWSNFHKKFQIEILWISSTERATTSIVHSTI